MLDRVDTMKFASSSDTQQSPLSLVPHICERRGILSLYFQDTTKSVPLVNNRNFTLTPIDDHQPLVRIMWYRFLLIISKSVSILRGD